MNELNAPVPSRVPSASLLAYASGLLPTQTGRVTDFVYDGQGNVLSAQRGALRIAHRYDSLGRRIFSDYGRGVNVSFGYGEVVNEWTSATVSTRGTYTRRFTSSGRLVEWSGRRTSEACGGGASRRDAP
jgi:hypothetical protein